MRCSYYCVGDIYDIDELAKYLREEGREPKFYDNVVHIRKENENETFGDVFIFPYGCAIFWGLEEEEEHVILSELRPYVGYPLMFPTHDQSTFHYGNATVIEEEDDEIVLESDDVLIKLSISHGLSQSVKLEWFEESVSHTIEKTRHLPEELARKGKIYMSRKKLSKKIGALFAERNSINLHSDILDTPEFFWRRPRYEPYYLMASEYMDIQTRLDILNRRLNVIHELYDILSSELNHRHSSRLELTIILLILIEVVVVLRNELMKLL
ncbi:MAG: RMD1 family protein [Alphaproteobacteria bacterium]|nr:RMD1 family protein [Alphaproteobacteria bacterium]